MNYENLPESLWSQDLLGFQKDAEEVRPGKLALAHEGTLFLEEAGSIPLSVQAQLKEALHQKSLKPMRAEASRTIDVRVVASVSEPLEPSVRTGAFREDLFYRLQGIKLFLPPLRERNEDLPRLADLFFARYKRLHASEAAGLAPDTLACLMEHDFPGNDRELEVIIEKAIIACGGGVVQPGHLPAQLRPSSMSSKPSEGENMKDVERNFLLKVLRKNNNNKAATARELGMHKTTLWRKMRKLGIENTPPDQLMNP
jgi:transcriptional regulator with PAS, ATPase and Fis domain